MGGPALLLTWVGPPGFRKMESTSDFRLCADTVAKVPNCRCPNRLMPPPSSPAKCNSDPANAVDIASIGIAWPEASVSLELTMRFMSSFQQDERAAVDAAALNAIASNREGSRKAEQEAFAALDSHGAPGSVWACNPPGVTIEQLRTQFARSRRW